MSILENFKQIKKTDKEFREFGVGGAIFLTVISAILWWNHHPHAWRPMMIACPLLVTGLAWPRALKPVYLGAMLLTLPIGWVMTRLILGIVFFIILTPLTIILRLTGKKFLNTGFRDSSVSTYWIPKNEQPQKQDYERQF